MSNATVLLAKGLDTEGKVIEVRATPFYETGNTGVADSIEAAQKAGIRVPSYLIVEGRIAAGRDAEARGDVRLALEEPVWSNWHDTLAETNTFFLENDYGVVGKGRYVVDIQNGTLFSHDHQRIRDSVLGRNGLHLYNGAIPLTEQDADLLFNQGLVYSWKDGEMKPIKPDYIFTSGNEFLEASADPAFLKNMPVYAVIRTGEEADKELSDYQAIDLQRNNVDLAIRLGGKEHVGKILDLSQRFGWKQFGSHHDSYNNANGGRVVVVGNHYGGVNSYYNLNRNGRSLAVAPEALAARAKIVAPLPLENVVAEAAARDMRMVPEDHVRRLLTEHLGYTGERAMEHLNVLARYK